MNPLKEKLKNYRIILGSQSPRRKHLLKELELDFEVIVKDVDESFPEDLNFEEVALFIAGKKAKAFIHESGIPNTIIITADSIVCIDGHILNKPVDEKDACTMLKMLSGKKHIVITGVCIKSKTKTVAFSSRTEVHFKRLSDEEINYYVDQFKPLDKAGAYGIQEWIGFIGVDAINGSYTNVMGLPVNDLYDQLMKF